MDNEKKKDEELQSRREFFKRVGKGVLPILGAAVFANLPTNTIQAQFGGDISLKNWRNSCGESCQGKCKGSCKDSCEGSCTGDCKGTCSALLSGAFR